MSLKGRLTPTRLGRRFSGAFGRGSKDLSSDTANIERGLVKQSPGNQARAATKTILTKALTAPYALANYTTDSEKPTAKRVAAYFGIPLSVVGLQAPAAIVGSTAVLTGKGIRVGLTEAGAAVGAAKGAIQLPFTTTYGVAKGLYHAPGYLYRKAAAGLARRSFTKRTGFNTNAISGELDKLERKKTKSQSKLNALVAAQKEKIEKQAAKLTKEQIASKIAKYGKQSDAIQAKLNKRNANISAFAEKQLTKTRKSKEKYGTYQSDTLATEDELGSKSTANKAALLRSRMANKFEQQRLAYNTEITSNITAKRDKLQERIRTQQAMLASKTGEIENARARLEEAEKNGNRTAVLQALANLKKLESNQEGLHESIKNTTAKLTRSVDKEEKLLASKGLQAKRDILTKRREALARSEEGLKSAAKSIVAPITSVYYGAKLGYQIGKTVDNQIMKFINPGSVNAYSNSGNVIGKTFKKFKTFIGKKTNKPIPATQESPEPKIKKQLSPDEIARLVKIRETLVDRKNALVLTLEEQSQTPGNGTLIQKLEGQLTKYDNDIIKIDDFINQQAQNNSDDGSVT